MLGLARDSVRLCLLCQYEGKPEANTAVECGGRIRACDESTLCVS